MVTGGDSINSSPIQERRQVKKKHSPAFTSLLIPEGHLASPKADSEFIRIESYTDQSPVSEKEYDKTAISIQPNRRGPRTAATSTRTKVFTREKPAPRDPYMELSDTFKQPPVKKTLATPIRNQRFFSPPPITDIKAAINAKFSLKKQLPLSPTQERIINYKK